MNNNNTNYDISKIKDASNGNWHSILTSFGVNIDSRKKHQPCPICGGEDRFRFDNQRGDGTWYCSQGESTHAGKRSAGDGFSLLNDYNNGDLQKTIKQLGDYLGLAGESYRPKVNVLKENVFTPVYFISKDKTKKIKPVKVWEWAQDEHGFQWYLARVEWIKDNESKKIVYQIKYNSLTNRFEQGAFDGLRPILGKITTDKVIIVEGEKTRDAAEALLKDQGFSAITWVGGANACNLTDWSALFKKEVYLFPDNDEQGIKAMKQIAKIAKSFASEVYLINPPARESSGWDLGDALEAGWSKLFTYNYICDNLISLETAKEDENEKFKILGYDGGTYYFLSKLQKTVISITDTQFSPEKLYRLKPQQAWFEEYADQETGKLVWAQVYADLIDKSIKVGKYNQQKIRGAGVYLDRNRKVFNLGNKVLLDGEIVDNFDFPSNYIYENRTEIKLDISQPLNQEDLKFIYLLINSFSWTNKINADLFIGGLILAPICGALRWRPHLWLTGPAGSGKSTIFENLILSLLDGLAEGVEGETTEAGIRQKMQSDARPVIFEEAEMDSFSAKKTMEKIITLARQASTETRTKILKGSINNQSVEYQIKSMFIFASVQVGLKTKADKDRTAVLSLDKNKSNLNQEYAQIQKMLNKLSKIENLSGKWARLAYNNLMIIRHNSELFSDVISEKYTKRFGDQYGTLLAAKAIVDQPGKIFIDIQEARNYLDKYDLSIFENIVTDTQEKDILQTILQSEMKIELDRVYTYTIAQMIDKALDYKNLEDKQYYIDKLLSVGIKIDNQKDLVFFSVKSKAIEKYCGFNGNFWHEYLERIPGISKPKNAIRFGNSFPRSIAVQIPLSQILDKEKDKDKGEVLFP
jgi:putative DNA primase/helicase